MWAEHPEIARRWSEKYKNKKNLPMYVNPEKNDKNGSKKEAQLETKPHKLKSAKKPHNILPFFVTSEKNATVLPCKNLFIAKLRLIIDLPEPLRPPRSTSSCNARPPLAES